MYSHMWLMTGASALVNQGETITNYTQKSWSHWKIYIVVVSAGHLPIPNSVNSRRISNQGANTQHKETEK